MFSKLLNYFKTACTALVVVGTIAVVTTLLTRAGTPGIINYQGRVQVNGADFTGSGQFKFALVSSGGTTTYWSNDGSSTTGNEPTKPVALTVTKGLYAVLLGDATITNMTVIPSSAFSNSDVRLRIWFNDGTNGSQLLTPDQRITAAGYAMVAAGVDDGTITTTKIADGAVTQAKLAAGVTAVPSGTAGGDLTGTYPNPAIGTGAVTASKIANGVIPTSLPPNGSAGGDLTGTYPNPTIASGAVTAGKIAAGVIPTTLPPNGVAGGGLTGSYPNPTIAANAIGTTALADGSVTSSKLATGPQAKVTIASAGMNISNNTFTNLQFDTTVFDTLGSFNAGVNNTKLFCKEAGTYLLILQVSFANNSTGTRSVEIDMNGTQAIDNRQANQSSTSESCISAIVQMNVGDSASAKVYQNSGGTLMVQSVNGGPTLSMIKIR